MPIFSNQYWIFVLFFFLSSCGTSQLVKEHIKSDNIAELINDHNNLKSNKQKKIESFIFTKHDFSKNSYGELKTFRDKSISDNLRIKFAQIIDAREDSILAVLDGYEKITDIASYYKKHADEQPFLNPIIAGTLLQNIQNYEYSDVRAIYREFKNTDIQDSIYTIYQEKRSQALPLAMNSVDKYCKSEIKLIDIYKKEGKKRIPQVSSIAFEKIVDQLLDCDLSQNMSKLKDRYSKITYMHNPITSIKDIVKDEAQKMSKDINECRSEIVKELLDCSYTNRYRLPTFKIAVKKKPTKFPTNDFMAITNIYNKPTPQSKTNTLLSIASWLPGYVGAAATIADLYKTYKDTKKQAGEVAPYIKRMATVVFKNFTATCSQEYDDSFEDIRKSIVKSQEKFKEAIYEDF